MTEEEQIYKINHYSQLYENNDYFLSDGVEGYDEYREGSISYLKKIELDLLNLQPNDRFLDIGCGRGEALRAAAQRCDFATGIDISSVSIAIAKSHCSGLIHLTRASAAEIPYRDNTFTKILSGDVIEHLPPSESDRMLAELKRVLSPGGTALIHTAPNIWFMGTLYPIGLLYLRLTDRELFRRVKQQSESRSIYHINEYYPNKLLSQARRNGLRAELIWPVGILRGGKHRFTKKFKGTSMFELLDEISLLPGIRNFCCLDIFLTCKKIQ